MDEMAAALGGRAAEHVVYNKISTGALSDLEKVTKQAYAMVTVYGLNDKIGNISYYDSSGQSDYSFSKPYSEKTAELIDQEVKILVESAYVRAINLLHEHREKLDELAKRLLEREVLYREDLEEIFGNRTFDNHADNTADLVSKSARPQSPTINPSPETESNSNLESAPDSTQPIQATTPSEDIPDSSHI